MLTRKQDAVAVESLLGSLESFEEDLPALRDSIRSMVASSHPWLRDAGRCWGSALGALVALVNDDQEDSGTLMRECAELFARGTHAWFAYLADVTPDQPAISGSGQQALQEIGRSAAAASRVVAGDEEAIAEVCSHAEKARRWLIVERSDDT